MHTLSKYHKPMYTCKHGTSQLHVTQVSSTTHTVTGLIYNTQVSCTTHATIIYCRQIIFIVTCTGISHSQLAGLLPLQGVMHVWSSNSMYSRTSLVHKSKGTQNQYLLSEVLATVQIYALIFTMFYLCGIHRLKAIHKRLHLQKFRPGSCAMAKHGHFSQI